MAVKIDPKTGLPYDTKEDPADYPSSVLTPDQQAAARNSIATGGRSVTGQTMGNIFARPNLAYGSSSLTQGLTEAQWRDLYARRSTLAPGSKEWLQLVLGANIYNPRAKGTPSYRGTHDTLPGETAPTQQTVSQAQGTQAEPYNPFRGVYQRLQDKQARGETLTTGERRFLQRYTPPNTTTATGGPETVIRPSPFVSDTRPTTLNGATPGTAAVQGPRGQEGASTNMIPPSDDETQNQVTQFRSSRTGYSGNRRYHPFGGGGG